MGYVPFSRAQTENTEYMVTHLQRGRWVLFALRLAYLVPLGVVCLLWVA